MPICYWVWFRRWLSSDLCPGDASCFGFSLLFGSETFSRVDISLIETSIVSCFCLCLQQTSQNKHPKSPVRIYDYTRHCSSSGPGTRTAPKKMLFIAKINPDAFVFVLRDIPQVLPQSTTCGMNDTHSAVWCPELLIRLPPCRLVPLQVTHFIRWQLYLVVFTDMLPLVSSEGREGLMAIVIKRLYNRFMSWCIHLLESLACLNELL